MADFVCCNLASGRAIVRQRTKGRNCHMSIEAHLATLEKKHFALEEELHEAMTRPSYEDEAIADIKRRKLRIKDEIEKIRSSAN
jgi:hypothetical protein